MSTFRSQNGGRPAAPPNRDRRILELEGLEGAIGLNKLLDALHRSGHRLPVHVAVYITHEVARALRHLHDSVDRQGRVHGSVNANNVLILRTGRVKLIARSTLPSHGDRNADVFMLGVVAWEMLVGWPPDQTPPGGMPVRPSALRPDLPDAVDTLVLRALERNPRRRYSSAGVLAGDTARFLATRPDPRRGLRLLLQQLVDGATTADPSGVTRQTRVPWRDGSGALPALPPPPPSPAWVAARPSPTPASPLPAVPETARLPPLSTLSLHARERLARPWLGRLGILLFQTVIAAVLAGAALLALGLVHRGAPTPAPPPSRSTVIVPTADKTPSPPTIIHVEPPRRSR